MSISIEDIDDFSEFAKGKLIAGHDVNLVSLAAEWQFQHDSDTHLAEDVAAVQEALNAIDNGESGRPLSEFDVEFRKRNGIN